MHPIYLIPLFLTIALAVLSVKVLSERLLRKSHAPRPTYYVQHPDGSFTEANPQP